jgi:FkbM family methyltransferase
MTKKFLVNTISKTSLQPLLYKLQLLALTGMNYGNANTLGHDYTGEKKVIEFIEKKTHLKHQFIFFDVGANEGNFSLLVASVFKQRPVEIFAFEPTLISYNTLKKNTGSIKNIRLFQFGFGAKEEALPVWSNYEGSGATSLYSQAFANYSFNRNVVEEISLKTLDGFCNEYGVEHVDFLKIDVEGHELFVLQGAQQLLQSKRIQFIQFEFGSFHVYSRTFFKDFWDLLSPLYTIYRIIGNGLYQIKSYSENLEVFRTANFLAELR